jgi:hypothetical protein
MLDILMFLWDVVYLGVWIVWVAVQTLLHFASPWGDTVGPELDTPALLGLAVGGWS